jgi:hypothetical protein
MLKKSASVVLASFRSSTYPRGYASGPSLAAALLDELFEHPVGDFLLLSQTHRPSMLSDDETGFPQPYGPGVARAQRYEDEDDLYACFQAWASRYPQSVERDVSLSRRVCYADPHKTP